MPYKKIYKCDICGSKSTYYRADDALQGFPCPCGGTFDYVREEELAGHERRAFDNYNKEQMEKK